MNKNNSKTMKSVLQNAMQAKLSNENNKRILWVSNAPWAGTGYGQQSAQMLQRLKKEKYELAAVANYGLEAASTTWPTASGDVKIYPRGYEVWSNDIIPAHMYDWCSQDLTAQKLLITLFDVWVFKGPRWDEWPIASWVPIDHLPAPDEVIKWCKKPNVTPIAMSKFGKDMLNNVDVNCFYVPHAIEKVFKPTEKIVLENKDVLETRQFLGLPKDAFVVGMNAANKGTSPSRKAFAENFLAFSLFARKHPDAILYLHTDPTPAAGGLDLISLLKAVGLKDTQYRFIDTYLYRTFINQETLASIYTEMDVLLATSFGEGFGVPTIEAQACGTPVIASNFMASQELIGDGWAIDGQPYWDASQKSWFNVPLVPNIVEALEAAYNRPRERSKKAIEFAAQYEADLVFETMWKPTLKAIFEAQLAKPMSIHKKSKN